MNLEVIQAQTRVMEASAAVDDALRREEAAKRALMTADRAARIKVIVAPLGITAGEFFALVHPDKDPVNYMVRVEQQPIRADSVLVDGDTFVTLDNPILKMRPDDEDGIITQRVQVFTFRAKTD